MVGDDWPVPGIRRMPASASRMSRAVGMAGRPAYILCGSRAAEACSLDLEDFDLRTDDEHVRVHGKGGTVRTVLLDDRGYVALLKLYLARAGYKFGPVFRASINGKGGPRRNPRRPPTP